MYTRIYTLNENLNKMENRKIISDKIVQVIAGTKDLTETIDEIHDMTNNIKSQELLSLDELKTIILGLFSILPGQEKEGGRKHVINVITKINLLIS